MNTSASQKINRIRVAILTVICIFWLILGMGIGYRFGVHATQKSSEGTPRSQEKETSKNPQLETQPSSEKSMVAPVVEIQDGGILVEYEGKSHITHFPNVAVPEYQYLTVFPDTIWLNEKTNTVFFWVSTRPFGCEQMTPDCQKAFNSFSNANISRGGLYQMSLTQLLPTKILASTSVYDGFPSGLKIDSRLGDNKILQLEFKITELIVPKDTTQPIQENITTKIFQVDMSTAAIEQLTTASPQ